jgi:hypothetical protein
VLSASVYQLAQPTPEEKNALNFKEISTPGFFWLIDEDIC